MKYSNSCLSGNLKENVMVLTSWRDNLNDSK